MLADLFDGTFRTLSRTWLTTLVCGGVLFIPVAVFSGWSFGKFFTAVSAMAGDVGTEELTAHLLPLGVAYAWIVLAALAQGFAILFVRACVTECTARVVRGEKTDPLAIAGHVFTRFYGRLIGQRALQYLILGLISVGLTTIGTGAVVFLAIGRSSVVAPLAITVAVLGGLVLTYYLAIRWSLTLESIVVENRKIRESFTRSTGLVHGAWWRIFGFTLLISLMVSFGVSLIATPVVFFATIRRYVEFVAGLEQNVNSTEDMMSLMKSLFSGMAPQLAILTYVQGLLSSFVAPVFMTLLFFELGKRTDASDVVEAPAAPPSPEAR
jgi:hypothetical protein